MAKKPKLTDKQRAFIDSYLGCLNATRAAREAGYKGEDRTLRSVGSENLAKPNIRAEIDRRMKEAGITDEEIMFRLKAQASANFEDLIEYDDWGYVSIDVAGFLKAGFGHLIKEIKEETALGNKKRLTVKLHDSQAALMHLAKLRGMLKDDRPAWKIEIINLVVNGETTIEQIKEEFGDDLVNELFNTRVSGTG